jgi:hypothetical protein
MTNTFKTAPMTIIGNGVVKVKSIDIINSEAGKQQLKALKLIKERNKENWL